MQSPNNLCAELESFKVEMELRERTSPVVECTKGKALAVQNQS